MRLFFCESTKFKSNFEVTEVACYCGNQVNGEIYNHEELRRRLPNHKFRTGSDCEVIAHLVGTLFSIFAHTLNKNISKHFLFSQQSF